MYNEILKFYEDFKLHKGELHHEEGFFPYVAPSSIHSWHTDFANGIREARDCAALYNCSVTSKTHLEKKDIDERRFYVRLKACLYLWKKYTCGIEIYVNGKLVHKNDEEFMENVNLGWPVMYYPIESSVLIEGENIIEIKQTTKDNSILVSDADLLSLPQPVCGQQIRALRVVRRGEKFSLCFYTDGKPLEIANAKNCRADDIIVTAMNEKHTIVKISDLDDGAELKIKVDGEEFNALLPELSEASDDFFLLGIDSDDHRHDDSDETGRIMEVFTNTVLGDFWQARPKETRNYIKILPKEMWKSKIEYMKDCGIKFGLSDDAKVLQEFKNLCGESYFGDHCHEPYLYFLPPARRVAPEENETFSSVKESFINYIRNKKEELDKNSSASVGSPTPLLLYETSAGYDRVTIEPVANLNLIIGAACAGYSPVWGAHIPVDWYFGEPNDLTKSRKFLASLYLCYMNGASYIYPENAVFKTNAMSREDWESDFCVRNRKYMREFFDYTKRNPRHGKKETELAIVYGNNEFFMWYPDALIADGLSMSDPDYRSWTAKVWGKWNETGHQKCWRAIEAWIPPADNQNTRKNIINQELFSGTPYGSVDILPYEKDYSDYKSIAFLGWNTYENGFAEKIFDYVENGGVAYVSYCHFNRTDRNDREFIYADEELKRFFDIEIKGLKDTDFGVVAEVVSSDNEEQSLILKKKIGKGVLYFGTFADYTATKEREEISKSILREMADRVATIRCSSLNVTFAKRRCDDGSLEIDLLNVNTNSNVSEKFTVSTADGRVFECELMPCETKRMVIW